MSVNHIFVSFLAVCVPFRLILGHLAYFWATLDVVGEWAFWLEKVRKTLRKKVRKKCVKVRKKCVNHVFVAFLAVCGPFRLILGHLAYFWATLMWLVIDTKRCTKRCAKSAQKVISAHFLVPKCPYITFLRLSWPFVGRLGSCLVIWRTSGPL